MIAAQTRAIAVEKVIEKWLNSEYSEGRASKMCLCRGYEI